MKRTQTDSSDRNVDRRQRNGRRATALFLALAAITMLATGCGDSAKELTLDQVRVMHARGHFEPTIESLRARLDRGERDSETLLLYGTALTKMQLFSQAIWPLREAAKDPEMMVPAMMQLASGAYVSGNQDLAIEQLGIVLENEPDHLQALTMRGMARLHTRRDYEGALEDIERALDIEPDKAALRAPRVVALLGLKDVEGAREAIDALGDAAIVGEDEESETPVEFRALACVGRAKFTEEDGNKELAGERYSECVEAFPTQAIAVNEAMEHFRKIGDFEKFDAALEAAYEAAPEDRGFRIAFARRQQILGNVDRAREVLEEGAAAGYPGARVDLAGFLKDAGDLDAALAMYDEAQSFGASNGEFILSYGESLIEAGDFDKALALAEGPGPESHRVFIRGRVSLKKGEFDEALEQFTRGVLLWPDNAVARYYTARAAEMVGDIDRAIEEYRNAMRVDSDAADARVRLARLHLAERNPQAAYYIIRHSGDLTKSPQLSLEETLIELEAIGWIGQTQLDPELVKRVRYPGVWGQAVAAYARGVRARAGAAAGMETILAADRLDLAAPNATAALRLLVEMQAEAGEQEAAVEFARKIADSKRDEHPMAQVILAEALLRANRAGEAAQRVDAVLESHSKSAAALMVRARIALAQKDAAGAIAFLDRVASDRRNVLSYRDEAAALAMLGRPDDAQARLVTALELEPSSGETAFALAKLALDRGGKASDARVAALLNRAARLRGGEEARDLLGLPPLDRQPVDASPTAKSGEAAIPPSSSDG